MAGPGEDDREAVDRAFAELVAGYHLTAERPDPPRGPAATDQAAASEPVAPQSGVVEDGLVFRFELVPTPPPPPAGVPAAEPGEDVQRYVPEPLPPLGRPGVPALLGWIGIAYAALIVLAATFGVHFPTWAGWLAVGGFIVGFGLLMTRLPRDRPPDAGDGAVL
jgi:hypothetical protein